MLQSTTLCYYELGSLAVRRMRVGDIMKGCLIGVGIMVGLFIAFQACLLVYLFSLSGPP